jgi:Uncharacterised nucleotidyltransferase
MGDASDQRKRWVTQMLAARMVARVASALGSRARVMPVKGVLVARRFYDDPAERPMSDCDLVLVGMGARDAARRLVAEGWRVADWSNDPDVVDVAHPSIPGIHADLHSRPLPVGYGAVTAAWMADGATEDRRLFGVPVLVPDDRRLLVHLLGNILRDHIVNARAHTADDIARVLARSPHDVAAFAAVAHDARLRLGCWAALDWVGARVSEPRVAALRDALALSPSERRLASLRTGVLNSASTPKLVARIVARCVSDAPGDAAVGVGSAAYGVVSARALSALDGLRERLRSR